MGSRGCDEQIVGEASVAVDNADVVEVLVEVVRWLLEVGDWGCR